MSEELLDPTPPRSIRWLVVAAALVVGAALVARWLFSVHGEHHSASPSTASTAPPTTASATATVAPPPTPTVTDPGTIAVNRAMARAEAVGGVTTPVRVAECWAPAPGTDPVDAIASALKAHVPGFTVSDSVEERGRHATVCEVDLRARNALGGTVVVSVVAPPHGRGPALNARQANDRTVVRDVVTFSGGWQVEVGWVAQTGAHVSAGRLIALARDHSLRW